MRGPGAWALLLVLTVHTGQAQVVTGALLLEEDWVVGEGETLVLGPGAVLTGPARLQVRGTLEARGEPGSIVQLAVPLDLLENGSATLRHVRLWGVDGVALTVRGGRLALQDGLVEGNGVGILARGGGAAAPAALDLRNVTFRDHAERALDLRGAVQATLRQATFVSNAQNVVHAPANGSRLALEDARLGPPTTASPSLTASAPDDVVAEVATRNVTYDGGEVAVRIEGAGLRLVSRDDSYARVRVALQVPRGEANVTGARFDTLERDVDAGPAARLAFRDVRFTPALVVDTVPPEASAFSAWWILGVGLVAAGGAVAWARLRPRERASLPVPEAMPAPAAAPPPDLTSPLSEMERRILHDVQAHPGTAQAAIAQRLGVTRQALHYHVKKLETRRLIQKAPHGRETRCTLAPGVEELLRPPP